MAGCRCKNKIVGKKRKEGVGKSTQQQKEMNFVVSE